MPLATAARYGQPMSRKYRLIFLALLLFSNLFLTQKCNRISMRNIFVQPTDLLVY